MAKSLEGLNRHAGKHAAGVVIAEKPLWEYVPCFRPAGEEGIVNFSRKSGESNMETNFICCTLISAIYDGKLKRTLHGPIILSLSLELAIV